MAMNFKYFCYINFFLFILSRMILLVFRKYGKNLFLQSHGGRQGVIFCIFCDPRSPENVFASLFSVVIEADRHISRKKYNFENIILKIRNLFLLFKNSEIRKYLEKNHPCILVMLQCSK